MEAKGQIAMQVKLEDLPAELLVRSVWVILGGLWEQLAATRRAMLPEGVSELHDVCLAQIDSRLEELEMLGQQLDAWLLKQHAKQKRQEGVV